MNDTTPPTTGMPTTTVLAILAFLASCFMLAYLAYFGVNRHGLMVPVVLGWIFALVLMRTLVDRQRLTALYFAFAILALMFFFIHQTYGYKGEVRNFPLIIGYTGVVICILDILSLSNRALGHAIASFFGSHLDEKETGGRSVKRELITFAAMGACVLGIWLFGFLVFSPIFVAVWMIAGGKSVKNALYGALFTLFFIYVMFELAFSYELYRGIVFLTLFDF